MLESDVLAVTGRGVELDLGPLLGRGDEGNEEEGSEQKGCLAAHDGKFSRARERGQDNLCNFCMLVGFGPVVRADA